MSNTVSLATSGPAVSAHGNKGKSSPNLQGDGDGFAQQLSNNKTAKTELSQSAEGAPAQVESNADVADLAIVKKATQLDFADKMKLNYEFKSDLYSATPNVELNIDEQGFNLELGAVDLTNVLPEILPDQKPSLATQGTVLPETLTLDIDDTVLKVDIETAPLDEGILVALNKQLNTSIPIIDNIQVTNSQLDKSQLENVAPNTNLLMSGSTSQLDKSLLETTVSNTNLSVSTPNVQMDAALKSVNPDVIDLNKATNKTPETANSVVHVPAQTIDASKANNGSQIDMTKAPTNAAILTNLASGGGLSDQGSDQQREGNPNQLVNQVDKAGVKVEGVEVLQARVFPAISLSNGTNIADAMFKSQQAGGSAALQDIDSIYNISQTKTINTLKIQLVPANLGVVTAVMKLTDGELQVQLQVDNVEAYRKLSADSASIVNALKSQGFGIEQVGVQLMSGGDRNSAQGQQQNGQSFQDQSQQETSSSFDRDRSGSSSANSNEQNQGQDSNESDVLQPPQVANLSNGVYL